MDLHITAPDWLIDHLATDEIEQPKVKQMRGLGEALRIARHVEKLELSLTDDLDELIKIVRNNLIHLSDPTFNMELSKCSCNLTSQPSVTITFDINPSEIYASTHCYCPARSQNFS